MAERELAIVIKARDLATRTIQNVNRQLGSMGSNASRGLANASRNIERGFAVAGAAAAAGLTYALKVAGDFEAQMNTLNTIARATGDAFSGELGEIGDGLRKMARDTGTPLEELTTAYYDLLSAGIQTAHAQDVLTASNRLAIGGLASTAETIDLLTTAINSYGGDATKAAEYADNFAVAIERGKVTASEIAASFAQVGPLAASMGIGIDEISALLANMTARGTPAAEAFTQMRAAMISLQRQTPEMKRVLEELGITNVEAAVRTEGLVPVFDRIARKADELGIPMIKLTGRVEGTLFALANTGAEFEAFQGHLEAVRSGTGTAQAQMEERQQGLNFQLARMRAILGDVAITLGSKLIPKVVPLLQRLAETIEANQDKIAAWADDVAAGFERAVKWAMSLDWNAITSSLRMAAGFGKTLMEMFINAPPWLQTAVLTGWGLNKLTGGALGGIVGELSKGLIRGVLNMNAGVVNVNGRVVNGPGGGSPFGGRGPGGFNPMNAILPLLAIPLAHEVGKMLAGGRPFWDQGPTRTMNRSQSPGKSGGGGSTADTAGADQALLAQFGGRLDKLATNEVVQALGHTTEMGLANVGTSFQAGLKTGLDPVGDIATRILQRAEDPRAPAVMTEIQGHLSGLEEIQRQYLATGDVHLAAKVQGNIDALHDLVGTTDTSNAIAQRQIDEARSADQRMIAAAERTRAEVSAKGNAQLARQAEALAAVRAQSGTLAQIRDKRTSITVPVSVSIVQTISVAAMQTHLTELRQSVGGGGFI